MLVALANWLLSLTSSIATQGSPEKLSILCLGRNLSPGSVSS